MKHHGNFRETNKKKPWEQVINRACDPELEYEVTLQDLKCFPRELELEVMTLHEIGQYLLDLLTLAECSAEEPVKWEIQKLAILAVQEIFRRNR